MIKKTPQLCKLQNLTCSLREHSQVKSPEVYNTDTYLNLKKQQHQEKWTDIKTNIQLVDLLIFEIKVWN